MMVIPVSSERGRADCVAYTRFRREVGEYLEYSCTETSSNRGDITQIASIGGPSFVLRYKDTAVKLVNQCPMVSPMTQDNGDREFFCAKSVKLLDSVSMSAR